MQRLKRTVENFYKCFTTNLTWKSWNFFFNFLMSNFQLFFSCQIYGKAIGESFNFFMLSFSTVPVFHVKFVVNTYLTGKEQLKISTNALPQIWHEKLKQLKMTTWKSWNFLQLLYHIFDRKRTVEKFYKCLTTNLTWESWKKVESFNFFMSNLW